MSAFRRRVLVSAYAVSPVRGSEPGVGWNLCVRLAAHHDVTVFCAPGEPPRTRILRDEIADHVREHGAVAGLRFEFVEPPPLAYVCQRESLLMRRTLYYAGYRAWQRAAYRRARRLHQTRPFDLAHQLGMTGFREPGYLWKLPVPFVWGPIGGAMNVPSTFLATMRRKERLYYRARNVLNSIQKHTLRRCRRAARRADHLWAIGDADRLLIEQTWGCQAEQMGETGTSIRPGVTPKRRDRSKPLRIVWSGTHIGRKAFPILLHAIARLRATERSGVELVVVGDGSETRCWRDLAASLGVAERARWTGRVPRAEALDEVASADVLAFTSVQEGTPHVVLEALSFGVPVICHDACGMGMAVTGACGVKIPLADPPASVEGFCAAIRRLLAEPHELARMSEGALRRAAELSWDAKAQHIAHTYERVISADRTCALDRSA